MTIKKDEKTMPLSEIVPEYNSSLSLVKNLFWNRIKYAISFGDIDDSKKILDIGCGIGNLLREIRKKNEACELYGVDFNVNVRSLSIPSCKLKIEDANNLSFEDNYFDIVYALDVLEHIKEVEKAINEIKRILKPNGKLIITGPTESFFYKLCRFLIKGTFSEEKGPGTGVHYHNIYTLDKQIIKGNFSKENEANLPKYFPFILMKVIKYNNKK
jgi:ubiquinone/menaquinone biosynthesis C-methylase UbiE